MDKGDSEIAPPWETTVAVLPLTSAGRGRLVIGAHCQPLMRYFLSKTLAAAVVTLVALPLQESAAETRVEGIVPVRALRLDSATATVLTLKPADDGKALIVRLFGSSGEPGKARLIWTRAPKNTWLSDTGEQALQPAPETIDVPPWGIVTLRAEW